MDTLWETLTPKTVSL